MIAKVARLVALVDQGWSIRSVESDRRGDLTMVVGRGPRRESFDFRFYEVPAILHATETVGVAE